MWFTGLGGCGGYNSLFGCGKKLSLLSSNVIESRGQPQKTWLKILKKITNFVVMIFLKLDDGSHDTTRYHETDERVHEHLIIKYVLQLMSRHATSSVKMVVTQKVPSFRTTRKS